MDAAMYWRGRERAKDVGRAKGRDSQRESCSGDVIRLSSVVRSETNRIKSFKSW